MSTATLTDIRERFVKAALECLGTPFAHQGRCLGAGLDCGGPVVHACKELGLFVHDPKGYGPWGDGVSLRANLHETFTPVDVDDRQAGDVLLFFWSSPGIPQHVGIESTGVGNGLLHTSATIGQVIDEAWNTNWQRRLLERMRHPELM